MLPLNLIHDQWEASYSTCQAQCRVLRCDQVEACDQLGGFLMLQSVAGGTGAGLGSAVAEALRDDYGSSFILNHCMW
jgi:Tubulin/FtsZ family, GTPase domain